MKHLVVVAKWTQWIVGLLRVMNIIFVHTVRHTSPSLYILMSIVSNFPELGFKAKAARELLTGPSKGLLLLALVIVSYRLMTRLQSFILIYKFLHF